MNTAEHAQPQPGDLLGWVIYFGKHQELRAFINREDGETHAMLRASQLHGQLVCAVAGERPQRSDG